MPEATPEPTTTQSTPPPAEPAAKTFYDELLSAVTFSPPFFLAWGLGYMDDKAIGVFMMVLPVCASRAVDALGGKGAWARKTADSTSSAGAAGEKKKEPASAAPTKLNHLAESLNLP